MGCTGSHNLNNYSNIDTTDSSVIDYKTLGEVSGPYISPLLNSFESIEKFFTSDEVSLISMLVNRLEDKTFSQVSALGFKPLLKSKSTEGVYYDSYFHYLTYEEVFRFVLGVAKSIDNNNSNSNNNSDHNNGLVGILSRNCPEWVISDIASMILGRASVGIGSGSDSSSNKEISSLCTEVDELSYLLNSSNSSNLLFLSDVYPNLKNIIIFDYSIYNKKETLDSIIKNLKDNYSKIEVILFSEIVNKDKDNKENTNTNTTSNELHSLLNEKLKDKEYGNKIYTYFTTNTTNTNNTYNTTNTTNYITQKSMSANLHSFYNTSFHPKSGQNIYIHDSLLNMETRIILYTMLHCGVFIGLNNSNPTITNNIIQTSPSLDSYSSDLFIFKPNILLASSLQLNSLRYDISNLINANQICSKSIMLRCINNKKGRFKSDYTIEDPFYDKFVTNNIRKILGSEITTVIATDSSFMSSELMEDFKILFSVPIIQLYSASNVGIIGYSSSLDYSNEYLCIGSSVSLRLVNIQKYKNYKPFNKYEVGTIGEIEVKGPQVSSSNSNNWYATKDLGFISTNNKGLVMYRCYNDSNDSKNNNNDPIVIEDKAKFNDIICIKRLEGIYLKCKYIESLKLEVEDLDNINFTATIKPRINEVKAYISRVKIDLITPKNTTTNTTNTNETNDTIDYCNNDYVKGAILKELRLIALDYNLMKHERIEKINLIA